MRKHNHDDGPLTSAIRQAVEDSGMTLKALAEAAGIERMSLSRFMRRERTLRLPSADALAVYFGLTVTAARQPKRKGN